MAILKLLVGLVVVFLLVVFAIANMGAVAVNFYFYKTPSVPLFVVIFLSLLLGVMLAWVLVIGEQLRLRNQIRARDRRIRELEKELEGVEGRLASLVPEEREEKKEVPETRAPEPGQEGGTAPPPSQSSLETPQEEPQESRED